MGSNLYNRSSDVLPLATTSNLSESFYDASPNTQNSIHTNTGIPEQDSPYITRVDSHLSTTGEYLDSVVMQSSVAEETPRNSQRVSALQNELMKNLHPAAGRESKLADLNLYETVTDH